MSRWIEGVLERGNQNQEGLIFQKRNTTKHKLFILDIIWSVHKMGVGLLEKLPIASHEGPRTKVILKFLFVSEPMIILV